MKTIKLLELEALFRKEGIDFSYPGFYNDSHFIRNERKNNEFLNTYANYVELMKYSKVYIERVKTDLPQIISKFSKDVIRDGRLGSCVDCSMVLSLILERAGYWNYMVKGSLTIVSDPSLGYPPEYFWTFNEGTVAAPHAWVIAPPFLIDPTIKMQPYRKIDSSLLPDYICSDDQKPTQPTDDDLISDEIRAILATRRIKDKTRNLKPAIDNF